ncbi:hypothetical protein F511_30231 [Dorcoceras hygrometricum]|uniref:Uncharacterized protein n=1 Tax=Dorcoceras hygrometricum TaxID=472368 RepID=A0A2Z7B0T7_9LAMI|nr:hypothetical protein F511_30231 [Dorcoceras hygrometricum]
MHGFFVDVSDLHSYDHDHVLPHVHLTVFELSCMVSVDGLIEWFWIDVRWFMVVLGMACNGSKWGFKGRTVLGMKKTISSSYMCPADGSQYYRSAVGLVFMESAVELAMETSKVISAALPVQARRRKTHVYVVSHTSAAVVHLWSLGVLTAAGCGIGSVHAVVRSNLLVEPSEVEEGEM